MSTNRVYQKVIKNELTHRLQKNSRYSLRAFARSLNVDVGALSRIMNGQKIPTPEISRKIISQLLLSPKEKKDFLYSMARAYEEDGVQRKKPEVKALLKKPSAPARERDLTPDLFRIISDWYHYAILQLIETKNFQSDARWIAQQLNIQEMEAKLAIDRLQELELIEEVNGRLVRTSARVTSGDLATTSAAHRKRIKQVTEKSINSLENDAIALRNHTTLTMAIDPEQMPIAKEMIQNFMDELAAILQTKKKNVYELQINLFPLQRSEK